MSSLATLARSPLPAGWGIEGEMHFELALGDQKLHLSGELARGESGQALAGSAASADPAESRARARAELLERICVFEAARGSESEPQRRLTSRKGHGSEAVALAAGAVFPRSPEPGVWRHALSNGVALGLGWEEAADRALLELLERHFLLRSWFGGRAPREVPATVWPDTLVALPEHTLRVFLVSEEAPFAGGRLPVVSLCVAVPSRAGIPLAYGSAARWEETHSLEGAYRECVQRLGFLAGEPLPEHEPPPSASPEYHQEFYLHERNHEPFWRWLSGEHETKMPPQPLGEPTFLDLSLPGLDGVCVVKAIVPGALPLTFGRAPDFLYPGMPPSWRVHPIC